MNLEFQVSTIQTWNFNVLENLEKFQKNFFPHFFLISSMDRLFSEFLHVLNETKWLIDSLKRFPASVSDVGKFKVSHHATATSHFNVKSSKSANITAKKILYTKVEQEEMIRRNSSFFRSLFFLEYTQKKDEKMKRRKSITKLKHSSYRLKKKREILKSFSSTKWINQVSRCNSQSRTSETPSPPPQFNVPL